MTFWHVLPEKEVLQCQRHFRSLLARLQLSDDQIPPGNNHHREGSRHESMAHRAAQNPIIHGTCHPKGHQYEGPPVRQACALSQLTEQGDRLISAAPPKTAAQPSSERTQRTQSSRSSRSVSSSNRADEREEYWVNFDLTGPPTCRIERTRARGKADVSKRFGASGTALRWRGFCNLRSIFRRRDFRYNSNLQSAA